MSAFTRDLFAGLPPPAECLAILVGVAEVTLFGAAGLANVTEFAKGYGLPIKASTSPNKRENEEIETNQKALVAALAARNIEKGLIVLAFACYWRDRKALGTVVATGLVTTVADLLIVQWYGAKEAVFGHVIGVVNCTLIGSALLYWNRADPLW
jgi:hypothetical protein